MRTTERFNSLAEVRAELGRLRSARNLYEGALGGHWDRLRNKEFRRGLALDGLHDLVNSWKPMQKLGALLGVQNGSFTGARDGSLKKQLITGLASTVIPILARHFLTGERVERIRTELGRSWQRIKDSLNNADTD